MIIQELKEKGLAFPPDWLDAGCQYLTITGSVAYGVTSDTSDMDLLGFAIPPRETSFPWLNGWIPGFGDMPPLWKEWISHGIVDPSACAGHGRKYDFNVFSMVKFFDQLAESSPNMIESLFTAEECVIHRTPISDMVRAKRHIFLSKKCFDKFRRYNFKQSRKMDIKKPKEGSKRKKLIEEHGFDVKYGYNMIRIFDEVEQILTRGDLDLRRNREQLKACKNGEMTLDEVKSWVALKRNHLEKVLVDSKLPETPDMDAIKQLLFNCLEHYFGKLQDVVIPDKDRNTLKLLKKMLEDAGV